ncbi:hypothetical protein V6N12_033013 [Hibiscus sabdariffa]|uniref:Uncharacterized protein n=1 Tax=Hibiscus sabdariffa TaxID=183260 RepID=A0ABR2CGT8_9ROSI
MAAEGGVRRLCSGCTRHKRWPSDGATCGVINGVLEWRQLGECTAPGRGTITRGGCWSASGGSWLARGSVGDCWPSSGFNLDRGSVGDCWPSSAAHKRQMW